MHGTRDLPVEPRTLANAIREHRPAMAPLLERIAGAQNLEG